MEKCVWSVFLIWMAGIAVSGSPRGSDAGATIVSYDYHLKEDGYFFTYSTSNGIIRQENGVFLRDLNRKEGEDQILRVYGYYSYIGEDNKLYRVNYKADENGYKILRPILPAAGYAGQLAPRIGEKQGKEQQSHSISSAALASLSGS